MSKNTHIYWGWDRRSGTVARHYDYHNGLDYGQVTGAGRLKELAWFSLELNNLWSQDLNSLWDALAPKPMFLFLQHSQLKGQILCWPKRGGRGGFRDITPLCTLSLTLLTLTGSIWDNFIPKDVNLKPKNKSWHPADKTFLEPSVQSWAPTLRAYP